MPHSSILRPNSTALAVIDHQDGFRKILPDFDSIAASISRAVQGFNLLGLPVIVTEQYPKGLGHTAREILDVLSEGTPVVEKTAFSSCGASSFTDHLKMAAADTVVLCGIETHICVNQTAHDLLEKGFKVHLLIDAVGSRFEINRKAGLKKMFSSGVIPCSVEMALFELMRDSRHEKFREVQAIIK